MMTGRDGNQAPTPLSPVAVLQTVALLSERHAKEAWTLAPNSSSEIFLSPLFSWQPSFLHCSLPFTLNEEEWPHPIGRGLVFFSPSFTVSCSSPRTFSLLFSPSVVATCPAGPHSLITGQLKAFGISPSASSSAMAGLGVSTEWEWMRYHFMWRSAERRPWKRGFTEKAPLSFS